MQNSVEYLDLPEEVIEAYILPNLPWNDLLRHRRVCKTTRNITDRHLRLHPELAPELEIVEGREDRSFEAFLDMNIPTTKIYIHNLSGNEFYADAHREGVLRDWLVKYSGIIQHLRVLELGWAIYGKEWDFLECLTKLETLEAAQYGVGIWNDPEEELPNIGCGCVLAACREELNSAEMELRFIHQGFPSTILTLKRLKIGQRKRLLFPNMGFHSFQILVVHCKYLESASLPFNDIWNPALVQRGSQWYGREPPPSMTDGFLNLNAHILSRNHDKVENIKEFDFSSYHYDERLSITENGLIRFPFHISLTFLQLCENCLKYDVKLHNVPALWFIGLPDNGNPDVGLPVVSLVNIIPSVWFESPYLLNLRNMEKITILGTKQCFVGPIPPERRPKWPALKSLDITVDSKLFNNGSTRWLFQFLFEGMIRPAVTELRLNFANKDLDSMAIPKADDIVAACPNLKKLTIVNWPGTNKALFKLFDGLKKLEEVTLENCRNLGNVAFVGIDTSNPVMLKLKNLKKLILRGLDQMPKITDLLFNMVIRKLSLSHLVLTSDAPLEKITMDGIKSLLSEGTFADSIEKFPFEGWSLADVSKEELAELEKKFRSYDMY